MNEINKLRDLLRLTPDVDKQVIVTEEEPNLFRVHSYLSIQADAQYLLVIYLAPEVSPTILLVSGEQLQDEKYTELQQGVREYLKQVDTLKGIESFHIKIYKFDCDPIMEIDYTPT